MNILQERKFNTSSAVVIGKFDGVHSGHKGLLNVALDICRCQGFSPLAYTFCGGKESITDDFFKAELLAQWGMENIYIQQFDDQFKNTSPEEFINILKYDLKACHVVAGFNFRFGKDRAGDTRILEELCSKQGIDVTIVPPVMHGGEPISSTRIRNEIKAGNIAEANLMLGRQYSITAKVVHGKSLGRTIDFPTANMSVQDISLLPGAGVYATSVEWCGKVYPAITNIGSNPTVDSDNIIKAETHIIDFDEDLYGKEITVNFASKIRDERVFESLEDLKKQLMSDKEKAIN